MGDTSLPHAYNTGIYEILNIANGKAYIGSALSLTSRWNEHRCGLSAGRHHSRHLQLGKKRGPYNLSPDQREALRQRFKEKPVSTLGRKRPPEEVARIAERLKGRKLPPEQIAKISAAATRMWADPQKRAQIVESQRQCWERRRRKALE